MSTYTNERVVQIRSYEDDYDDYDDYDARRHRRSYHERPPRRRRGNCLSNLLTIIALIGLIVGGTILGTTLWQEYQRVELTKAFKEEAAKLIDQQIARDAFKPVPGDVVGLIIFPQRDNLTVPIVDGVREQDLYAGVGHYDQTGWPGDERQIFLAGHRNTEFGALQYVEVGEEVIVEMAYGTFVYKIVPVPNDGIQDERVHAGRVVHETQTEVINIEPAGEFKNDQLVLMTCYPFTFGASLEHRFLLYAERVQQ